MKRPFLSICIPTYNRGEVVQRTVKNILENYSDADIEVVVSDNCSTDDTKKLLSLIKDERLQYFRNDYNNGFENLVSVLTYARGEYCLLDSDEDDILLDNVGKLIEILKEERPAVLLGGASIKGIPYVTHWNGLYNKGFEAIRTYGSGCSYMSGYVYSKEIMDIVLNGLYGTEVKKRFGYAYCFTNLAREMLQFGSLSMREEILTNQRESGKRDMAALFQNDKLAYSPEMRLCWIKEKLDSLLRINLSEKEKYILCRYYMNKDVLVAYINDYRDSFNNELLDEIKKEEGSDRIFKYYMENRRKIIGKGFYEEIEKGKKEYEEYIDTIGLFQEPYKSLANKYSEINCEYLEKEEKILEDFRKEKESFERD